jgi:hypothetical protein
MNRNAANDTTLKTLLVIADAVYGLSYAKIEDADCIRGTMDIFRISSPMTSADC